jgi:hypothetical protein
MPMEIDPVQYIDQCRHVTWSFLAMNYGDRYWAAFYRIVRTQACEQIACHRNFRSPQRPEGRRGNCRHCIGVPAGPFHVVRTWVRGIEISDRHSLNNGTSPLQFLVSLTNRVSPTDEIASSPDCNVSLPAALNGSQSYEIPCLSSSE